VGLLLPLTLILAPAVYAGWGPIFGAEALEPGWLELVAWRIDTAGEAWVAVPFGVAGLILSMHLLNLEAWLVGQWARLMLGSRARDVPPALSTIDAANPPSGVLPSVGGVNRMISELTPRERDVLTLIARGYSNAAIAEAFVVSEGTVKTHVKRILAKLEVRDRTQAAVFAFDSGFITPAHALQVQPG
jgi:DNA-binding CsgD family transcriptional regulator